VLLSQASHPLLSVLLNEGGWSSFTRLFLPRAAGLGHFIQPPAARLHAELSAPALWSSSVVESFVCGGSFVSEP